MQRKEPPRLGVLSRADAAVVRATLGAEPTSPAVAVLAPPPAPTDGLDIAEVQAHSSWYEQWKERRRAGVGASEVACIAGVPGAYGSPFALWWNKKAGLEVEQETDELLVMGTRLEAVIGEVWQERNPHLMLFRPGAGLFQHPFRPWLLATPDFIAVSKVEGAEPSIEPVECKAYDGGKGWGTPGTDQVPPHVEVQVIMQCAILGAKRGHVARMQGKRVTAFVIEMTAERFARFDELSLAAHAFMESTFEGTPPPLDGTDATEAVLAFQYADVHEDEERTIPPDIIALYQGALDAAADVKRHLDTARNILREAMGHAEYAVDGQGERIAQRRVYKRREYTVAAGMVDGVWPIGVRR